jgi:hypothetical protein
MMAGRTYVLMQRLGEMFSANFAFISAICVPEALVLAGQRLESDAGAFPAY